jgi:hypothetical protein
MTPADDNTPRTPEEHRRLVAALSAGQDTEKEVRNRSRGEPTFARLKRAEAGAELIALRRFAADEGLDAAGGFDAANDNTPHGDFDLPEISRIDSRMDEENPSGDDIMAAWLADEKDRKKGRPEKATRIQFGAYGRIVAVKVRGRYRSMVETFSEPRGGDNEKVGLAAGYDLPDEMPDTEDDAARRMDHAAMKRRLGTDICRLIELACGDATAEEIGTIHGAAGKTAERLGVRLVDGALAKLVAEYAKRDAADREAA